VRKVANGVDLAWMAMKGSKKMKFLTRRGTGGRMGNGRRCRES
jgi:hypothetical protein